MQKGDIVYRGFYLEVTTAPAWVKSWSSGAREKEFGANDLLNDGKPLWVSGQPLIESFVSASEYALTETVSLTDLARVFVNVGDKPFTVCFTKANGDERMLVGKMVTAEDVLGRSTVYDFAVKSGVPLRQVDHRTLKYLIVNGVRYVRAGERA